MTPLTVLGIVRRGDELLLGRKLTGFGAGRVTVPGGKTLPGEDPAAALTRELREECGITVDTTGLVAVGRIEFTFRDDPAADFVAQMMTVGQWSGVIQASTELDPAWWPIGELPWADMWPDAAVWLPAVLTGRTITATFGYHDSMLVDARVSTTGGQSLVGGQ